MKHIKLWSDVIATWVTIIGIASGGIFALVQDAKKSSSERVREALEYVDRWGKAPLTDARFRLEQFWNSKSEEIFQKQDASESDLYMFVDSETRTNNLEGATALVISFFETIRTCSCAELCDEATVRIFFGKDAYDFHGLLFPYISQQRKQLRDNSFGSSLESLAMGYIHNTKSEFKKSYCAPRTMIEAPKSRQAATTPADGASGQDRRIPYKKDLPQ